MFKMKKEAFTVIGKEGSTNDGEGFVAKLWESANGAFAEVAPLAKRDEKGNLVGIWGAMTNFARTFAPWEENYSKGLYLAGVECRDDAEAPEGWTKWVVPAHEYLFVEMSPTAFADTLAHIRESGLRLAGAVQDFTDPNTGANYMAFPITDENIVIRTEEPRDFAAVENLVREAFWNVYRPGATEHYVLHKLRENPQYIPELSFVMEKDGAIIGQNVFFPACVQADDGRSIPVLTMGPICIRSDLKRKGYGKMLLDATLNKAAEYGAGAVCIEGNIAFYGQSGFVQAFSKGLHYEGLPREDTADFFLCKELIPDYLSGIEGTYASPEAYEADDAAVEEFDKDFPPMKKLKLPGQLF